MKRREFLKTSALVVAGTAVAASGLIGVASASEWTGKLTSFKPDQAQTLLAMCRQIFPHSSVEEVCYVKVVMDLDAESGKDPSVAKLLADGVAALDLAKGSKFAQLKESEQIDALTAMQDTPFFQKVRGTELQSLYNSPAVWEAFGYQGPAYAIGGYIHHGFNDLNWLPDPPESASPKPA